jgi:hypothetical protein
MQAKKHEEEIADAGEISCHSHGELFPFAVVNIRGYQQFKAHFISAL